MCGSATNATNTRSGAADADRGCNECETGGATNATGCNECGCATNANGVQQMRKGGATNVKRVQQMLKTGATNAKTGATNADSNGCFTRCNKCNATNATTGAMDARSRVCELCLGARRAGDSNTKWRCQGVLAGAHNLLENGRDSTERAK